MVLCTGISVHFGMEYGKAESGELVILSAALGDAEHGTTGLLRTVYGKEELGIEDALKTAAAQCIMTPDAAVTEVNATVLKINLISSESDALKFLFLREK